MQAGTDLTPEELAQWEATRVQRENNRVMVLFWDLLHRVSVGPDDRARLFHRITTGEVTEGEIKRALVLLGEYLLTGSAMFPLYDWQLPSISARQQAELEATTGLRLPSWPYPKRPHGTLVEHTDDA